MSWRRPTPRSRASIGHRKLVPASGEACASHEITDCRESRGRTVTGRHCPRRASELQGAAGDQGAVSALAMALDISWSKFSNGRWRCSSARLSIFCRTEPRPLERPELEGDQRPRRRRYPDRRWRPERPRSRAQERVRDHPGVDDVACAARRRRRAEDLNLRKFCGGLAIS